MKIVHLKVDERKIIFYLYQRSFCLHWR